MLHLRPPKSVLVTIGKTADHNGYGKTKNEHAKQCAKTTDEFALHATCTQFIFELASILAGGPCKTKAGLYPKDFSVQLLALSNSVFMENLKYPGKSLLGL